MAAGVGDSELLAPWDYYLWRPKMLEKAKSLCIVLNVCVAKEALLLWPVIN